MKINFYKTFIRSFLFSFPAEKAHHITFSLLRLTAPILQFFFLKPKVDDSTRKSLFNLTFDHPVGLAAGLDKDGIAYSQLGKLGFSFVEVGTVTPKPQSGNPRPRLFRIRKDHALINRMGFNNQGVDVLAERLMRRSGSQIIGGNIGKNTETPNEQAYLDYLYCFERLYGLVDYFVVNVSCPNIADLKDLQDKDSLIKILSTLTNYRKNQDTYIPILLKVSPDLNHNQLDDLIHVVLDARIDGLIATNTTITRDHLSITNHVLNQIGKGGLSGEPLRKKSLEVITYLREHLPQDFPIIASGCAHRAEDVVEIINAGAQLVQIYTGFIYEGPGLIRKMVRIWKDQEEVKNRKSMQGSEERKPKN